MSLPVIVTGDDVAMSVTLYKNSATFEIDAGATVSARFVLAEHTGVLTDAIAQVSTATGADWANSLVMVEFSSAVTGAIKQQGEALVEIQVDDSGKRTWFVAVEIVRGQVD